MAALFGEVDRSTAVFSLGYLVLVHLDAFVGIGKFLVEDFEVVFALKDGLPLFGGILLQAAKFFLNGPLNLDEFAL